MSNLRLSDASASAITPSSAPTAMATPASNSGCGPVDIGNAGDEQRQQNAQQRHGILEQHGEDRHVVAVLAYALPAADLLERDAEGPALQRQREHQETDHERREWLDRLLVEQRVDAVVDIDPAADEEDADGGDERPEEFLLAAAERMLRIRAGLATDLADLQQHLVADVRQRVDRFGEKRRRSGDEPTEALGCGDRGIGRDR